MPARMRPMPARTMPRNQAHHRRRRPPAMPRHLPKASPKARLTAKRPPQRSLAPLRTLVPKACAPSLPSKV
jgi:hypothetical protein